MVHIVTIDGKEYLVRGDEDELAEAPKLVETGGTQQIRFGKLPENWTAYFEIDGVCTTDLPMRMREPLARGEIKDTKVGDVRLVKYPLRKDGKPLNLLLSHNAATSLTKL